MVLGYFLLAFVDEELIQGLLVGLGLPYSLFHLIDQLINSSAVEAKHLFSLLIPLLQSLVGLGLALMGLFG